MNRMSSYASKFRRSALSFGASTDTHERHPAGWLFRIGTVVLLALTIAGCAALKRQPEGFVNGHEAIIAGNQHASSDVDPRLLERRSTPHPVTPSYRLGPGDELNVMIIGEDELSGIHKIGPDGSIVMPLIGDVSVDGLTRAQANTLVADRLQPFFDGRRDVAIEVTLYENNKVYVLGRVEQPGIVELTGEGTLLQALAEAGGLPVREYRSYLARAAIIRGRDEILWVDLIDLFQNGNLQGNIPLRNGDIVYVPDSEDTIVFVMGEVVNPGAIPIKVRLNLTQALAQAGGPTEDADWEAVYLIRSKERGGPGEPVRISLADIIKRADFTQNYVLKSGDILYIARNGLADINYYLRQLQPVTEPLGIYTILKQ